MTTQPPAIESVPVYSLAETIGKWGTFAGAILLVLSVSYDFSYLLALGLSFQEIPTNISDHIRSAIIWAPYLCISLVFGIVIQSMLRMAETERPASRFQKFVQDWYWLTASVVIAVVSVMSSSSMAWAFFLFLFVWMRFYSILVKNPERRSKFTAVTWACFQWFPLVLVVVGGMGYGTAFKLLEAKEPAWRIEIKSDIGAKVLDVAGFRRFSEVAVIVGMDHRVSVIPAHAVVSAEPRSRSFEPLFCKWTGWVCKDTTEVGK